MSNKKFQSFSIAFNLIQFNCVRLYPIILQQLKHGNRIVGAPNYKPKMSELLGPLHKSFMERSKFILYGQLGQLLYKEGCTESMPIRLVTATNLAGENVVYDREEKKWIPYNEENVPWTYTLAPVPRNKYHEMQYFIQNGGLVKHKFIWATSNGLTMHQFEKLKSRTNHENYGRFTITPHIPIVTNNGVPALHNN